MGDVPADPVRCLRVGGYLLSGLSVYQRSHSMGSPNSKKRSPVSVVRMERTGRIRMPDELRKLSDSSTMCALGEPDGTDSIAELGEPGGMHASAMQCIKLTDRYVKTAKAQGMSREAYTLWLPILLRDLRLTGLPPAGLLPMGPFPVLKRLEFRGRSQMRAKVSGVLTA